MQANRSKNYAVQKMSQKRYDIGVDMHFEERG
jgi:hypothetical protein